MIPALALIISAYIVFRMLEVFAFPATRYSNTGVRVVMCILAAIVILVVGFNVVDIFFSAGVQPGINLPTQ
jgi:hypothetical protein